MRTRRSIPLSRALAALPWLVVASAAPLEARQAQDPPATATPAVARLPLALSPGAQAAYEIQVQVAPAPATGAGAGELPDPRTGMTPERPRVGGDAYAPVRVRAVLEVERGEDSTHVVRFSVRPMAPPDAHPIEYEATVGADGGIDRLERVEVPERPEEGPATDAAEHDPETVGTAHVREYLTCILGSGLHERELEPGELYQLGEGAVSPREAGTGRAAFGGFSLRFERLEEDVEGRRVASFRLLLRDDGRDRAEPRGYEAGTDEPAEVLEDAFLGEAEYDLEDGLLWSLTYTRTPLEIGDGKVHDVQEDELGREDSDILDEGEDSAERTARTGSNARPPFSYISIRRID